MSDAIPPTGSSTSTATTNKTATSSSSTTVDYNSFLKLLVQELKNQDPTSPSDPTQYLSQIATFSNVEQGVNTNNKLSTLLTTASLTQAEGALGRTVTSGTVTGTVTAVALDKNGAATATLSNGQTLTLDNTVSISSAPAASTSTATSS